MDFDSQQSWAQELTLFICAALDKPFNLSELLFSHWEIWKTIVIIIIPKSMDWHDG